MTLRTDGVVRLGNKTQLNYHLASGPISQVVKKGSKKFGNLGRRSFPPFEYKDLIQEARDKLKPFRDGQGRCFSRGGAGQDKAKS